MRVFLYFVSTTSIVVIVPVLLGVLRAHSEKNTKATTVFKFPSLYIYIGVFGIAFSAVMATLGKLWIINKFTPATIVGIVACLMCFLMGLLLLLLGINWKVDLNEDYLLHINFLGIVKKHAYSKITRVVANYDHSGQALMDYEIFFGKRRISIEYTAHNFLNFERLILKRLKKAKNPIVIERKKSKL